jgi:hypothetical protein
LLRFQDGALIAGAALAMSVIFLLVKDSLIDDAYISLAYARNFALHLHWGLIADETSNTVTSPLNALLLGGLTAATRLGGGVHPIAALGLLSVAEAGLLAWVWIRIARALALPFAFAVVGCGVIVVNPFLLSAIGLETLLGALVITALVATALEDRPVWFGAVAGLALLTRLDLIVFVVLVAVFSPALRRRFGPVAVVALAIALPWFTFSWLHFGSAVPDTLVLKTSQQGLWRGWSLVTGPTMYYTVEPAATVIAFLPAALGLIALVAWLVLRIGVRWPEANPLARLDPLAGLGLGGLAYLLALSVLGLGPYHWYYVPAAVALSTFLVGAVGVWWREARTHPRLRPAAPATALTLVGALGFAAAGRDLDQGIPWRTSPVTTNWATTGDYARVGEDLRRRVGSATVRSPGEIGSLAYFCRCRIVDAVSDPGYVVKLVDDKIATSNLLGRALYRFNYHRLDRSQRPRRLAYRLLYEPGPASGPDSWQVWSPWKGVGHFRLARVS